QISLRPLRWYMNEFLIYNRLIIMAYSDENNQNKASGEQTGIRTQGGDVAGGDVDKRQGAFVRGGTLQGPVIGENQGPVTANYYLQQAVALSPALHQLR